MLRSFEQLGHPADRASLVAADEERLAIRGSGAGYAKPWHWHDCLMFILPSQGVVELRHEDRREGLWLSQDRFAIVPANRAHETRSGVGAHHHLALYVTDDALRRLDENFGSLREFRRRTRATMVLPRSPAIRALQDLSMRHDVGPYGDRAIRQNLASALVLQCVAEAAASQPLPDASRREHGSALVTDIKAFVMLHAAEDIPLDRLGDRFGVSRRHVTRLFRQETGQSIGEFQLHARLERAVALLSGTDLPVTEIAFRVGFESGAAFARAMKRVSGRNPLDVRHGVARSIKQ
ncbi:helix-turn-helix domain-containing protein [Bradyrhizobium tropiciagri]|uniref:helix-turn-helix domain-containing protein n=1 Tax=Bradyrhizobium tropiciagri TaxID=312253 RepID=UPI001BACF407|nr:helix-turn-helix domain-containing protein [Bradyrhizobium tropiciagri]MBR0900301.1 helix-turn-helix domain-containing protein [Bradyrhizobium tropiciagri]